MKEANRSYLLQTTLNIWIIVCRFSLDQKRKLIEGTELEILGPEWESSTRLQEFYILEGNEQKAVTNDAK
jgi:hypothetical protein